VLGEEVIVQPKRASRLVRTMVMSGAVSASVALQGAAPVPVPMSALVTRSLHPTTASKLPYGEGGGGGGGSGSGSGGGGRHGAVDDPDATFSYTAADAGGSREAGGGVAPPGGPGQAHPSLNSLLVYKSNRLSLTSSAVAMSAAAGVYPAAEVLGWGTRSSQASGGATVKRPSTVGAFKATVGKWGSKPFQTRKPSTLSGAAGPGSPSVTAIAAGLVTVPSAVKAPDGGGGSGGVRGWFRGGKGVSKGVDKADGHASDVDTDASGVSSDDGGDSSGESDADEKRPAVSARAEWEDFMDKSGAVLYRNKRSGEVR
jgi:hypothetical protein